MVKEDAFAIRPEETVRTNYSGLCSKGRSRFMRSSALAISIITLTLIVTGCTSPQTTKAIPSEPKVAPVTQDYAPASRKITIFQSSSCGCCGSYRSYLEDLGFQVAVTYIEDTLSLKLEYQIPQNMISCHTAIIENYFVEGHIPVKAIDKLLAEKPDIDGIALPGMPPGAPGMPGAQTEAFKIYALSDGVPSEFMIIGI